MHTILIGSRCRHFALRTPVDRDGVNADLSIMNMKSDDHPAHESDGQDFLASPHVTRPVARPLSCSVQGVLEGHWRRFAGVGSVLAGWSDGRLGCLRVLYPLFNFLSF